MWSIGSFGEHLRLQRAFSHWPVDFKFEDHSATACREHHAGGGPSATFALLRHAAGTGFICSAMTCRCVSRQVGPWPPARRYGLS